jgi:hypothetical protein
MKKTIILIILTISVIVNGCKKTEPDLALDIAGTWKVISYDNYDLNTKITRTSSNTWTDYNNGDVTINFKTSGSQGGDFTGINVTNRFSGKYVLNSTEFGAKDFITTEINEPEWAQLFHSINDVDRYEVFDNKLVLYYNQKKNGITLEKQ